MTLDRCFRILAGFYPLCSTKFASRCLQRVSERNFRDLGAKNPRIGFSGWIFRP